MLRIVRIGCFDFLALGEAMQKHASQREAEWVSKTREKTRRDQEHYRKQQRAFVFFGFFAFLSLVVFSAWLIDGMSSEQRRPVQGTDAVAGATQDNVPGPSVVQRTSDLVTGNGVVGAQHRFTMEDWFELLVPGTPIFLVFLGLLAVCSRPAVGRAVGRALSFLLLAIFIGIAIVGYLALNDFHGLLPEQRELARQDAALQERQRREHRARMRQFGWTYTSDGESFSPSEQDEYKRHKAWLRQQRSLERSQSKSWWW